MKTIKCVQILGKFVEKIKNKEKNCSRITSTVPKSYQNVLNFTDKNRSSKMLSFLKSIMVNKKLTFF